MALFAFSREILSSLFRQLTYLTSSFRIYIWIKTNNFDSEITPPSNGLYKEEEAEVCKENCWKTAECGETRCQRPVTKHTFIIILSWCSRLIVIIVIINNVDLDKNLAWAGNSSPIRTQGTGPSPRVKANVKIRRRTFQSLHHFGGNTFIIDIKQARKLVQVDALEILCNTL